METFMAAYVVVGIGLAAYVLHLRRSQRRLEQRAQALEDRLFAIAGDPTPPRSFHGG